MDESRFILASALALVSAVGVARADELCTPVEIPSLGGPMTWAHGLNDHGQVVGRSLLGPVVEGRSSAYVYRDGSTRALPPLIAGGNSEASAINDFGLIVGGAEDAQFRFVPVVWSRSGISLLPQAEQGIATDVNNRGEIVGVSDGSCVYWQNRFREPTVLGLGGEYCVAEAISDRGVVVGSSTSPASAPRAHGFIWRNGVTTDIHTLPSWDPSLIYSQLFDVDDGGTAYGVAYAEAPESRPFLLSPDGTIRFLDRSFLALDLNRYGYVSTRETEGSTSLTFTSLRGASFDLGTIAAQFGVGGLLLNDRFQFAFGARTLSTSAWFCDPEH